MKTLTKITALSVVAIALASCGGTKTVYVTETNAPDTTANTPDTTDAPIATAPPEWTSEDEFILDIEQSYDNTIYLGDKEMLDAGYGTCEALRTGVTAYEVLETIVSSAAGDPDIEMLLTSVVASAVINLCPEQEYKFQS